MPDARRLQDILDQLEQDAREYFDSGRTLNVLDIALTVSTILTSLLAAIVAQPTPTGGCA